VGQNSTNNLLIVLPGSRGLSPEMERGISDLVSRTDHLEIQILHNPKTDSEDLNFTHRVMRLCHNKKVVFVLSHSYGTVFAKKLIDDQLKPSLKTWFKFYYVGGLFKGSTHFRNEFEKDLEFPGSESDSRIWRLLRYQDRHIEFQYQRNVSRTFIFSYADEITVPPETCNPPCEGATYALFDGFGHNKLLQGAFLSVIQPEVERICEISRFYNACDLGNT